MKPLIYIFTVVMVLGLGAWAYSENYATQEIVGETRALRAEIRDTKSRLNVLRAEWAYLNRPDRLRELANLNFDRLGLLPLRPDQFGRIDEVAFPETHLPAIVNPVELSSNGGTAETDR
ncbi:MAG: cell division protein FtsL [Rhodobacteraceae bacterium]|nr:cell division protein FtsL [Paracoccaceae bacterium]